MKYKALVFALLFFPLLAQAKDYEITVNRKKDGLSQPNAGIVQHSTQGWIGEVKVTNRAFKPSPELELRYIIFVKRQDLGKKSNSAEHVEKLKGSIKIASIKGGATATENTKEVTLRQEKLDPGYYFANGGIQKSEDSVLGIWVRLFNGATQVEESVNPTTLKGKQQWD